MFDFSEFSLLKWFVGIVALLGGGFVTFWVIFGLYMYRQYIGAIVGTVLVGLFVAYFFAAVFVFLPAVIGGMIL